MITVVLCFIISFSFVAFMLPRILILSLRKRLIDPIDPRKVHSSPASRLGGVTFFPAMFFASWLCIACTNLGVPFMGAPLDMTANIILRTLALLLLYIIGFYDDLISAPYKVKFLVQIFSALLVVASGAYLKTFHGFLGIHEIPIYIGVPLTLLLYVFITNALNLIDGIDGLASMLTIMALVVYSALMFINSGITADLVCTIGMLGALIPFWWGNVFGIRKGVRSKIFMGDTGALVVGATLGFLAISIWNISYESDKVTSIDQVYYTLAFTMLLVPCFDVLRVVLHRYLHKQPLFLPDKNHIHHKFMALGYSPRKSLLFIIMINFAFMALNIALSYLINFTYIIILDIALWTAMHILITKKINQKN